MEPEERRGGDRPRTPDVPQQRADDSGTSGDMNPPPSRSSSDKPSDRSSRSTTADSSKSSAAENIMHEDLLRELQTVNGSYNFTLSGYSLAKGLGPGNHINSMTFTVGGHDWAIYFFPDGKYEDHSQYVSVFVVLVSESYNVQALFEMSLVDRSGRGQHKTHKRSDGLPKSPYTLKNQGSMWGYKQFIRRDLLEKSNYLKDDTLEFTGRVGVLPSSVKATKLATGPASPTSPMHQGRINGEEDSFSQDSKHDGAPSKEKDSHSDDRGLHKFEGLRIEDELAKYYRKLNTGNNQSPISIHGHSSSHGDSQ